MTSPYEARLNHRIAVAQSDIERAVSYAELGCYHARIGDFRGAESVRQNLRAEFGDGRSLVVSVLIMTLEALLLYFTELRPESRDRLLRAKLLSTAAKHPSSIAITAAWLAHVEFNAGLYREMSESIEACLTAIGSQDESAECRVSLVLGDAFLYIGREVPSRRWYDRARLAANKMGDQAAIGALTYNRAALRVSAIRMMEIEGVVPDDQLSLTRSEVNSAINYQSIAGLQSLDHLLASAKIGILIA